jgi:hypothetical protein
VNEAPWNQAGYKPKFQKREANRSQKKRSVLMIHTIGQKIGLSTVKDEVWTVDSGASDHYCNELNLFHKVKELETPVKVSVANDQIVMATHKGDINIQADVGNKAVPLTLSNVYYVKELGCNLLSVSQIEAKGYLTEFGKG